MKKIILTGYLILSLAFQVFAQVAINLDGTPPNGSAMLDIQSTAKGLLAPRLTTVQRNAISNPATGLTIFQTDGIPGLYYNSGTPAFPAWALVGSNAGQWQNTGSNIYYNLGRVGVGTSNPEADFHVAKGYYTRTVAFGSPISIYTLGTNISIGDVDSPSVLYVGQSTSYKGYLSWEADPLVPSNAFMVLGSYNGSNNMVLQRYGGKVGVGTTAPIALFHVAKQSPHFTANFGHDIGWYIDGTNVSIGDTNTTSVFYIGQSMWTKGFLNWNYNPDPSQAFFNIGTYSGYNPLVLQGDGATGGKVGIGTTAPAALFHVAEQPSSYTGLFGTPISDYDYGTSVAIGDNNNDALLYIGQDTWNKGYLIWTYNATPANAYFSIGAYAGTHPLVLQEAGGKVGIGKIAPASRLDVHFDANSSIYLGYNNVNNNLFSHTELEASGDGQSALYTYRNRNVMNDGTGYGLTSTNTAMKGYSFWGDQYSFGTAGFNYNDYSRCGGVLGAVEWGGYWGSLGYKSSGLLTYGGYFTSYTSGTGKSSQPSTGIGIGAWGDLMGADIHGKVYGVYAEGENYATYSNGPVYKNNLDVHLQENGAGANTVLYTNVSTEVTVQTSGYATLTSGHANIAFDQAFAASVSSDQPVVVTVTPMGNSKGVYLAEVSKSGFKVVENNDGTSNVTVSYIAIGKRAGYENPKLAPEVIEAGYTQKLSRGLHNDGDTRTNGEGLYYQNGQLSVGVHPSSLPNPNKPAIETVMQKPSASTFSIPQNKFNRTGIGQPTQVIKQPSASQSSLVAGPSGGPIPPKPVQQPKPVIDDNKPSTGRSK